MVPFITIRCNCDGRYFDFSPRSRRVIYDFVVVDTKIDKVIKRFFSICRKFVMRGANRNLEDYMALTYSRDSLVESDEAPFLI